MQAKQLLSPDTYTYNQIYFGREINPVVLNKKWNEYLSQVYVKQLTQACKATGCIAVRSSLLTRTEKEKYTERRYHTERKVYYLFPVDSVPLGIYCKLEREDGKLIYE